MEVHPIIDMALQSVRPKENKSLIDILSNLEQIEQQFDDGAEISNEALSIHFDAITSFREKTDRLIGYMERLKMEAANFAAKAQAYKERSEACEANLRRVKDYTKYVMGRFPDAKFEGEKGRLALQRSQPSLVITMPQYRFSSDKIIPEDMHAAVPEEFKTQKTVWVYDSKAIKDSLLAGFETPIARLEQNYSVRIKI